MAESVNARRAILALVRSGKPDEAYRDCVTLAKDGSADAQILLGWMHQTGTGTGKNWDEAKKWYESAKADSPGEANFYLGTLYRARHDDARGLAAFEDAARAGYAPAMHHLGRLYLFGDGVRADEETAFRYFEQAADKGHLFARRNIARRMISGRVGIQKIPRGIVSMIAVFLQAIRVGWSDPDSEFTSRL